VIFGQRILSVVVIVAFVAAALSGCSAVQTGGQISDTRLLFDTFATIIIHGNVDYRLLDRAFALCAEYEALLSMTIEGSDIWRINHAGGEPVTVDPRTAGLISSALTFCEQSGGRFDITIGRLSSLWDFGGSPRIPTETEIEEALKTVDYRNVVVEENTVQLLNPNAWIDLGAIAKGYIAQRIAGFLAENGADGALVDLGGDIYALGNRQDGSPWRIAVRKPFGDLNEFIGVVEVSNASVSSSGIYERSFEKDGVLYHHILDLNTGLPAKNDVVSATVIAHALLGEYLSTMFFLDDTDRLFFSIDILAVPVGVVLVMEDGDIKTHGEVRLVN